MDEHLFEVWPILGYFFQSTTTTHGGTLSVLYVCVFAGFVETWNGRGFPQDTPNILRILELP